MIVSQVAEALSLKVRAGAASLNGAVTGAYTSDLLSCAMAGARPGDIWITLQGHLNVIAIASLNDLAAVIVTEDKPISPEALARADQEGIPILTTGMTSFETAGRLWTLLAEVRRA